MVLLEVCVDSIESAMAAANGGAHRIELCAALGEGGLTPSVGFFQTRLEGHPFHSICSHLRTQVFVMIRPRRGDFLYSSEEMEAMESDIHLFKSFGADGFVFGCLTANGALDEKACGKLLEASRPMPCTLHRAFDVCKDPMKCAEAATQLGFKRILTSGQQATAVKGLRLIEKLHSAYGDRITILAGSGVNDLNAGLLVSSTGVREIHSSASVTKPSRMVYQHSFTPTATTAASQFSAARSNISKQQLGEFELKITTEDKVKALLAVIPESTPEDLARARKQTAKENTSSMKPWLAAPSGTAAPPST